MTKSEQIAAIAETLAPHEQDALHRMAQAYAGIVLDDSARPTMLTAEHVAQSTAALADVDAGNGLPLETVKAEIEAKPTS